MIDCGTEEDIRNWECTRVSGLNDWEDGGDNLWNKKHKWNTWLGWGYEEASIFRYADFEMSMEHPGRDIKETLRSEAQGNDSF